MYNSMPELATKSEDWERGYCAQVLRGEIMYGLENAGKMIEDRRAISCVVIEKLERDKRRIPTVSKHLIAQGYYYVPYEPSKCNFDLVVKTAQKWEVAPKFKSKALDSSHSNGTKAFKDVKELYEPIRSFNDAEIIFLYYHQDAFDIKYMELERTRYTSRVRYMRGTGYAEKYQEWRAYPKTSLGAADMLLYEGQIEAWVEKNLTRVIKELSSQPIGSSELHLDTKDLTPDKMSWQVTYHLGQAREHLEKMKDYLKVRKYVRCLAKEVKEDDKIYPVILSRMSALVKKRAAIYAMDKRDNGLAQLAKTALQSGWAG
jgi:hypothetical protein